MAQRIEEVPLTDKDGDQVTVITYTDGEILIDARDRSGADSVLVVLSRDQVKELRNMLVTMPTKMLEGL